MLTNGILMTYAIEDILDGQAVVWIASDGSARHLQYIPGEIESTMLSSSRRGARRIAGAPLPGTHSKTRRPMSGSKWRKR